MRILTRYVLREFLVPLCYCLGGFLSIYVLFELFGSFSKLAEAKLPLAVTVSYFCGYISPYVEWLAPAALLLATLYTMWSFCRHSELVAMRSSGIGFLAVVKPLLAVAVLMALGVTWVNERYVPSKAQWATQLKSENFDVRRLVRAGDLVYRNARAFRTWSIDRALDETGASLEGVRITVDNQDGVRQRNILAEKAQFLDGEWWLSGVKVQHFDGRGQEMASPVPELDALGTRSFPELDEAPCDLMLQNRDWSRYSVGEKRRYLETHPELSTEDRRSRVYDLWAQIVAPWACLVITLFAIPAGVSSGRQSVFRGILGAIGMFFGFYALVIVCMALAKKGWLPPVPAAVLPDMIFLILGARQFYRQR